MTTSDYQIEFSRDPLMGLWSYRIQTPNGRILTPLFGISLSKEHIEEQAQRRIEMDKATETISGDELAERVRSRTVER